MITILNFLDKYNYENISRVTVLILSTLFDNALLYLYQTMKISLWF